MTGHRIEAIARQAWPDIARHFRATTRACSAVLMRTTDERGPKSRYGAARRFARSGITRLGPDPLQGNAPFPLRTLCSPKKGMWAAV